MQEGSHYKCKSNKGNGKVKIGGNAGAYSKYLLFRKIPKPILAKSSVSWHLQFAAAFLAQHGTWQYKLFAIGAGYSFFGHDLRSPYEVAL
jgi:hypothetical protein